MARLAVALKLCLRFHPLVCIPTYMLLCVSVCTYDVCVYGWVGVSVCMCVLWLCPHVLPAHWRRVGFGVCVCCVYRMYSKAGSMAATARLKLDELVHPGDMLSLQVFIHKVCVCVRAC